MFKQMLVLALLLPSLGGCIIGTGGRHGWPHGHGGHRLHGSGTVIVPVIPLPEVRVRVR